MSLDLQSLSIDELQDLIAEAKSLLSKNRVDNVKKAYVEYVRIASNLGMSVDDLILTARRHGATAKAPKADKPAKQVKPKYQDPNSGQTWSGRGKPPRWVADVIASGASLDSCLINQQ